jgi:hypothetical protein
MDQGNVSVMYVTLEETLPDICTKGMTRYVNVHICSTKLDQSENWYWEYGSIYIFLTTISSCIYISP